MKDSKLYVVVFTVAVTAFFGFLVSALNAALSERKLINSRVAQYRVILDLLGLQTPTSGRAPEEILQVFAEKVRIFREDTDASSQAEVYAPTAGGSTYVFPIKGQGFWDTIHGYIALDRERQILVGVAFTQHAETPGLGGRIDEADFRRVLAGKSVAVTRSDGLFLKFVGKQGNAANRAPSEVDGITGATGTTSAVERLLNEGIRRGLTMKLREGDRRP